MTRETNLSGVTRFDSSVSLDAVCVGDRIDPSLIPNWHDNEQLRGVAHGYRDQYQSLQSVLVYDDGADLFARLSGHTHSGAWNQMERDYKVRDVGRDVEIVDQWGVTIPDLDVFGETEEAFVAEWASMLFDNIRYGDDPGDELQEFEGKKFRLRDYDGRSARVSYELVGGLDE